MINSRLASRGLLVNHCSLSVLQLSSFRTRQINHRSTKPLGRECASKAKSAKGSAWSKRVRWRPLKTRRPTKRCSKTDPNTQRSRSQATLTSWKSGWCSAQIASPTNNSTWWCLCRQMCLSSSNTIKRQFSTWACASSALSIRPRKSFLGREIKLTQSCSWCKGKSAFV